ncbi:EAL domain-containing protein [Agrobacterium larrymoorei]|uniref:sensor domain-containing protein n=1 Tax=Agrobacterium larrymoorei TaxID=160699 RepID=UPI003CC7D24F
MAQTLKESKYSSDVKNAELELALQELSAREHDLTTLSRRLDLALESYNCGIWEADLRDNSAYWDPRMHQLYGLPFKGNGLTTRQMWLDCLHPNDRQSAVETADRSAERNETLLNVHRILLATGDIRYIRSVGQVHTARDGTRRIVGIAFDVTEDHRLAEELKAAKDEAEARNAELIEAKSRIEHNALHDPLTGLANRRRLDDELDLLSTPSVDPDHKRFAILHLDLDRFKQINDTLGHAAGDAMLVHTAEILRRSVHDGDVVARIGGDEFVILTSHMGDKDHVKTVAANIIGAFKHPFDFQGFTCRCGVSIGIAFGESNSSDARKTLINADLALYRAKALGRNRYEFFTQNLQAELVNHKRMADEILAGLENGEFETWYQPQFCIQSGNIVGIEALVRWRHPTRGLLTPDKFLKIAEELNVVQALDRIVLQTALQDRRTWNLRGLNIPRVAVNVSLRRLHDEHLVESLKELSIQPGEVTFELVESIFLDDSEELVVRNIERIKSLGIDIEIDDFGTGHTSLISLLRLKPNRLKIDRQLVMPILASPQERALVRSIIDIARSLGVETVAEGVETHGHATMLRQMGCDIAQGYAFSKPLPAQDFASFATSDSWRGFPQPLQEITA